MKITVQKPKTIDNLDKLREGRYYIQTEFPGLHIFIVNNKIYTSDGKHLLNTKFELKFKDVLSKAANCKLMLHGIIGSYEEDITENKIHSILINNSDSEYLDTFFIYLTDLTYVLAPKVLHKHKVKTLEQLFKDTCENLYIDSILDVNNKEELSKTIADLYLKYPSFNYKIAHEDSTEISEQYYLTKLNKRFDIKDIEWNNDKSKITVYISHNDTISFEYYIKKEVYNLFKEGHIISILVEYLQLTKTITNIIAYVFNKTI